jgi:hypothetical protein
LFLFELLVKPFNALNQIGEVLGKVLLDLVVDVFHDLSSVRVHPFGLKGASLVGVFVGNFLVQVAQMAETEQVLLQFLN